MPEAIREPTSPTDPHWKGFPENSTQCKGPEVSSDFSYSKTRKEANVLGTENKKECGRR